MYAAMAQLVEHILGKDEVPGPNPGSSSRQPRRETFGALAFYRAFLPATRYGTGERPGSTLYLLGLEESTGLFTVRINDGSSKQHEEKSSGLWLFIRMLQYS